MLKKPHNQTKYGNITKVKYFLPSNNQNKSIKPQYQESRLNQIKKSINSKYKASYSSSKNSSKRPSIHKIQNHTDSQNTEINFNQDVSFEIVGIRDSNEITNQHKTSLISKNLKYPLSEVEHQIGNHNFDTKGKFSGQNLTFRNQQQKKVNFSKSSIEKISQIKDFQKFTKNFPKQYEKQEFERFLQNLKNDENYQNTITMFTIMYFYEQKANKK